MGATLASLMNHLSPLNSDDALPPFLPLIRLASDSLPFDSLPFPMTSSPAPKARRVSLGRSCARWSIKVAKAEPKRELAEVVRDIIGWTELPLSRMGITMIQNWSSASQRRFGA